MKNCVLYHSSCYDGFGSAFAAWKKFKDRSIYLPCSYGSKISDEFLKERRSVVYILDFSFDEEILLKIKENCDSIVLIDHHKTAQEKLTPLIGKYDWLNINFDMNKSGALLSWEYFHGRQDEANREPSSPDVPLLIAHISDRDLWRFEMEGSAAVHKALVSYPMDFELWDKFDVEELKKEGVVLERMHEQLVSSICKGAFIMKIDEYQVPAVNTSIAWSEVGNKLLENYPDHPFAVSFTVFEDTIMWSLRSRKDFDVSVVAKKFGGGGHAQASGFKTVRF